MPYYRSVRPGNTLPVTAYLVPSGAEFSPPTSVVISGDHDISWRTKEPLAALVETLERETVEPYSWFIDRKKLAVRAFEKDPRFDPSLIREDKGHHWDRREWSFNGGLNFDWISSGGARVRFTNSALDGGSGYLIPPAPPTDLGSQAAIWYGRMAPVVGEFSLSTFLGELREGLPKLIPSIISRAHFARAAGNDYLNVEFGWKPLLDDLRKIAEILLSASYGLYKPLGAYHRRRELQPVKTFSRTDVSNSLGFQMWGNYLSGLNLIPSSITPTQATRFDIWGQHIVKSELTRWYEGEFTYIPKASFDPKNYFDRLETLLDPELTPSALWELTPWSWLTDWFFQIGGAISAMEAGMSNRILSSYFYAMEEYKSSTELLVTSWRVRSGSSPNLPIRYSQKSTLHTKRRIRGNPFGFTGTSQSPLSVEQSAILGALGLKKIR